MATLVVLALCSTLTVAQEKPADPAAPAPAAGRSLLPLADPIVDADADLTADSATSWSHDGAKWLLLEGDVKFNVGSYRFRASRAVVRIDTELRPGLRIRHLSAVLESVEPGRDAGAVKVNARQLLVTASTRAGVNLTTNLLRPAVRPQDALVVAAEQRIARYLKAIGERPLTIPPESMIDEADQQRLALLRERAGKAAGSEVKPTPAPVQPPPTVVKPVVPPTEIVRAPEADRIVSPTGSVSFNADRVVFQRSDEGDNLLALIGNVRILYQDHKGDHNLALRAENAVVFIRGDEQAALSTRTTSAEAVRGIYLEDNVIATDGEYTVRAPRVFYDVVNNSAVVLNAVFYTYDVRRQIPLYMRAEKIRQESRTSWAAENALFTTSEFGEPHFAIAASEVNVKQEPSLDGDPRFYIRAHDTTARVGNVPVFYWPELAGEPRDVPLRRITAGYKGKEGAFVKTRWDAFTLLGRQKPEGVDWTFDADYLGKHGGGVGTELEYDRPTMFGKFEGYLLPFDQSEDEIANRLDINHDQDTRGFAQLQHRHLLQDNWELSIEAAYVSDPTFLEEFFRDKAEEGKPFETSVYVKKQENDWAFTFVAAGYLNDFTAQTPVLQSPGYTVEKLPELGYFRVGTPLWDDRLTYFTETRLTRMRLRVGDDTPRDRGFSEAQSLLNFGIANSVPFDRAAGLDESARLRLDTRHEIQAPLKVGDLDVVPFASGRITAYDDNFEEYAGEDENVRLQGTVGVRTNLTLSKTDGDVDIPMLDVHRIRHILEPNADFSLSAATANPEDYPLYDQDIEGISEGYTARLGLRNTWQTQRGGPGRWRTVDWVVVNTDIVFRGDDADVETPIARYFGYRPEYAQGGDHFHGDLLWMVSDAFAISGDVIYSLEEHNVPVWHLGATMRHTDRLTSFVDYAELTPVDSHLLTYGFTYQLTRKYTLSLAHRIDTQERLSRSLDVILVRQMPRWRLGVIFGYDDVDDEETIGVVLIPDGFRGNSVPSVANSLLRSP